MAVRGCGNVIKYIMFLFNALILVAGCALVGFGIYTRTNQSNVTKFSSILGSDNGLLPTVTITVIVAGSIIIFLSFMGCCGAIKEVKCMLVTFFILLMLIFISFLVGGILFYAFRYKIEDITLTQLRIQLNTSYGRTGEEAVTEAWDYMQTIFHCCGVSGDINSTESWAYYKYHTDWFYNNTELAKQSSRSRLEFVPLSCCVDTVNTPNITKCQGLTDRTRIPYTDPPVAKAQMNDQLYTEGCYTSFSHMVQENVSILVGIIAGIAAVMVLQMVFSMCLCRRIRDEDYYECDDD